MQAQAVVATAPWKVEVQNVSVPEAGPDEIVIRVLHSWISNGTEGSFIRGERIGGDTPRRESDPLPFPHVPGYQKVGIVEKVGTNVTDFQIGDWVFATVSHVEGMFYNYGGHVSPAVTHRSQVWKLPHGVEPLAFSGLVLTQVGYNCAARPALSSGDATVVIGDGLVGHWTAQTLQARGARVLMIGRHEERLARFALGDGDLAVNEKQADVLALIRGWAPNGVQVVCDTVGTINLLEDLVPIMRRDGHISSAGFYGSNGHFDLQLLRDRELTLHAPSGWNKSRMDTTLEMVSRGELQTLPLITHRFPVHNAAEAYDLILSRNAPVLGVVLDWE
ncbi:MAG TPA: zinc-binding dehydrogenase [Abditibacteriaceae bacterium]|jgi:2-desacetyl-2-hydroxyethyl bacteriochlorophyllide A dehydrogenase